jgi:hypothetical protein
MHWTCSWARTSSHAGLLTHCDSGSRDAEQPIVHSWVRCTLPCYRFDMGVAANCWQFWLAPAQDWWAEFEAGDRVS